MRYAKPLPIFSHLETPPPSSPSHSASLAHIYLLEKNKEQYYINCGLTSFLAQFTILLGFMVIIEAPSILISCCPIYLKCPPIALHRCFPWFPFDIDRENVHFSTRRLRSISKLFARELLQPFLNCKT